MRGQIMVLIILLGIISLSLADYNIKSGEIGKYRWLMKPQQQYVVCCYCPLEAINYDKYIKALQIHECGINLTEDDMTDEFGHEVYPYCSCEPKMNLVPQFIGCKLPKLKDVEWDCDNGFQFPNVSVYTICEPTCTKDEMILHKTGSDLYRCSEKRKWENDPVSVSCKYKEAEKDNTVIIVSLALSVVPGTVIFVIIILCWKKRWYHACLTVKDKCSSSPESSTTESQHIPLSVISDNTINTPSTVVTEIESEMSNSSCSESQRIPLSEISNPQTTTVTLIESEMSNSLCCLNEDDRNNSIHVNSIQTESSPENNSAYEEEVNSSSTETANSYFAKTKEDVKQDEQIPLVTESLVLNCYNQKKQIVKVNGSQMRLQDGKIYYNVMLGNKVVIATSVKVGSSSDFSFDRKCLTQCNEFSFKINQVRKEDGGVYNWSVREKGNKEVLTGQFTLNVLDPGRQEPVGGESTSLLPCNHLNTESMVTIEEDVLEGGGPGTTSLQNQAVVCQRQSYCLSESIQSQGNSPIHSPRQQNLVNNGLVQDLPIFAKKNCEMCNKTICDALKEYTVNGHLTNICQMLDPPVKGNENLCWIGFLKFYRKELQIQDHDISSIRYHKKGNPDDGHMKYILNNHLPQNGFTIGHLVLYFSRRQSTRKDVLSEIQIFHFNCQFCNDYLKTTL